MNAQQLKNAILQEAITGRLVPQDPNDEPASVLLDRIRKEKAKLVKEGKLKKKDLEEKPISKEEIPFEIPESWEWVRLGTIISYQNGYAYNSSEMNKDKIGVPVIKSGNLMTLEVVLKPNNDYIEHPNEKMLASKIVKGDMLMCLSSQSDNPEPLGKTAIYEFDTFALLNQRVLKFRPYDDKLTRYLFYTINSFYFWYNVSHQSGGSAQANLKLNHVLDMLVPLPPLAEQHRIVAKIEELLPKVEEYGKAQEALDKLNAELPERLKKSILQEAITGKLVPQDPNDEPASVLLDKIRKEKAKLVKEGKLKKKDLIETPISKEEIPFEIPESWEWVRLRSVVSILGDGIHGTPKYDMTGTYFFINGNNLSKNKIVIKANTGKVNEEEFNKYRKELNDKTILVSINGTIGNVGHYNNEPVILGKSACYFNLMDVNLKEYVTTLLYTDYFLKYAKENATGSTIKNVSLAVMNDFLIPLPPLAEQHRIVAKIEELLSKIDRLKTK